MTNTAVVEKTKVMAPMAAEFREEAKTTRRVLERIPAAKLSWKPHPRSLSLGQLALHVAAVPGRVVPMFEKSENEVTPNSFQFAEAKSTEEVLAVFDQSVQDAQAYLAGLSDEQARADWTLKSNGRTLFTRPRAEVIRMIMQNHIYHHRGQLSVYLRMLDVRVPSIYGPSADDNPFV
jgi:uncharacterized damage-inducible protein DinB